MIVCAASCSTSRAGEFFGRAEVAASVRAEAVKLLEEPPLLLLASPFLRSRQTAEIAGDLLGLVAETDLRLSERDLKTRVPVTTAVHTYF